MTARIQQARLLTHQGPQVPVIWYDTTTGNRVPIIAIVEVQGEWLSAYLRSAMGGPVASPTGAYAREHRA